jgi:hypothetical protein
MYLQIKKMYQVVDKIASHALGLSFHLELGANISEESEIMWADFIKVFLRLFSLLYLTNYSCSITPQQSL